MAIARLILAHDPVTIDIEASYFGTALQATASNGRWRWWSCCLGTRRTSSCGPASLERRSMLLCTYKRRTEMVQLILDRESPYLTLATVDAAGWLPLHGSGAAGLRFLKRSHRFSSPTKSHF